MTTAIEPAKPIRDHSNFAQGAHEFKVAEFNYRSKKHAAAAARRRLKKAEFENNDTEFESAFASIAFTYLKERAPGLIENLIGFQLLDKSDENQKACGVFVCQAGERIIDIPMFFIKGELKGYQVMRIRNPEMFLVLREGFLDYILSQMSQDLGELGPPRDSRDSNRTTPNMELFAGQRYFKNSSEGAGLDPHFLATVRNQLGVSNKINPQTPWTDYGDDLDLIETIMEYEDAAKRDASDVDSQVFYKGVDPRGPEPQFDPQLTFQQLNDLLAGSPAIAKPAAGAKSTPAVKTASVEQRKKVAAEHLRERASRANGNAGFDSSHLHEWAEQLDVANEYHRMRHDLKTLKAGSELLHKKAKYVDIRAMLKEYDPMLKTAKQLSDDYPSFNRLMTKIAGEDWRQIESDKSAKPSAFEAPRKKLALEINGSKPALSQNSLVIAPKSELPEVVKLAQQFSHDTEGLVKEADEYGDMVFDRRDRSKLAEAYQIDDGYQSYSPTSIEMCEVLTPDSDFREMLIVPAKYCGSLSEYDFLYDPKKNQYLYATPDSYVARRPANQPYEEELNTIEKVTAGRSARPKDGELFMVVDGSKQFHGPYLCSQKLGPREFKVDDVSDRYRQEGEIITGDPRYRHHSYDNGGYKDVDKLIFSRNNQSSAYNQVQDSVHLIVPDSSRVLVIKRFPKKDRRGEVIAAGDGFDWYSLAYDDRDSVKLNVTDMTTFLREMVYGRQNLKIAMEDRGIYRVNDQRCNASQARRILLQKYDLHKESAEKLLNEATKKTANFIVARPDQLGDPKAKLAYYSPTFDEPSFMQPYSSESGRYDVQKPEEFAVQTKDELPIKEELEPWEDPDEDQMDFPEEMEALTTNDESGIMDDMAGLISLLRNTRIDTSIRKLTKSLLSTIDQLGRQIFIFYAHLDEFEEMFGENELADVESSIITVFESAGDLFISLIRRSDDPTPELDIADLPVS